MIGLASSLVKPSPTSGCQVNVFVREQTTSEGYSILSNKKSKGEALHLYRTIRPYSMNHQLPDIIRIGQLTYPGDLSQRSE